MKNKCQVFTPRDYVNRLLDSIDYTCNLYGKKIMENSCGDGNILAEVVRRYIYDCKLRGIPVSEIKNGLSEDIFGVEIDSKQYCKCIDRLNALVQKNGILSVSWNITCENYLKKNDDIKYDFVVGNPPYITYGELKKREREYLKRYFISCKKGKFDYCYAFLEKSLNSLAHNGKMAYLIPSSVYKTVFGKKIRDMMLPYVEKVIDYAQEKVFQDALVKSSVIVLNKEREDAELLYKNDSLKTEITISYKMLGEKWFFSKVNTDGRRFGDYFKVSHVVATLCNEAFVIKKWDVNGENNYVCNGYVLENYLVRDAISPKNIRSGKAEKIIFPYDYDENHKLIRFDECEFRERFPGISDYLNQFRKKLDNRDKDVSAQWFEYGRSQALGYLDSDKALISTIISNEVSVYNLNRKAIPYAGMYIVPKNNKMTINEGVDILRNKAFLEYVRKVGIPINGESVRITSKDIENYMF